MSGGTYDYYQYHIRTIWETIEREIERNDMRLSDTTLAVMQQGVDALKIAEVFAHRIDYLLAGDDGEQSFIDRLTKDVKALNERAEREETE